MVNIGYAKVSTDGQSLDVQLDQLQKAGCGKIFQEKISGAKRVRPQLVALLDYVREGDIVTVCKLDRIARSTKHLLEIVEQLEKRGSPSKSSISTSTPQPPPANSCSLSSAPLLNSNGP